MSNASLSMSQFLELTATLEAALFTRTYEPTVGPQVTFTGYTPAGVEAVLIVTDNGTSLEVFTWTAGERGRAADDVRFWDTTTPARARDLRFNLVRALSAFGFAVKF